MAKNGNYKVLIWRNGRRRVSGFGIFMVSYVWKGAGIALNIFLSLGSFVMPLFNKYVCKKFGGIHTGIVNGRRGILLLFC